MFSLPQYLTCLKTSRSLTDKLSFDVGLQEHSTGAALMCYILKLLHLSILFHLVKRHTMTLKKAIKTAVLLPTFLCQLPKCQGEACWWTIHPASKQRSEGEKVRIGDDLILVSVSTERYLVGKMTPALLYNSCCYQWT